ncbi:TPA: DUF3696 domain-containing protein [Enterobacter cloacae]|nr:DUF3696 domain-containing protein [Enterobacter cloacae]
MNRLVIENFKSLVDADIRLGKLTVFSGLNGSGKSSALQIFALLKQSMESTHNQKNNIKLKLRGPYVNLGRVKDIYCESANSERISIGLHSKKERIDLNFVINSDVLDKDYVTCEASIEVLNKLKSHFSDFQFIQADRIVPNSQYSQASSEYRDNNNLGVKGQYSADYLANNAAKKISSLRSFPLNAIGVSENLFQQTAPTDSLIDQVCGWMQHLSPGVKLSAEEITGTDSVRLKYNYTGESITSEGDDRRPIHVGFGLTYCLPIIISCLIAKNDSFLLLENPEAHLHPQGQFAMGILLAKCASDGVNVLVETHSDHVLNGIRVATKKELLAPDDVAIHYFTRNVNDGSTFIQSPNILSDGSITNWPDGFFDQWTKSLDILLG